MTPTSSHITPDSLKAVQDKRHLIWRLVLQLIVWTLFVAALLSWALWSVDEEMLGLAQHEARANFNKDQAFRAWATSHGGVYVPVTERTPPSPYMSHIPERDIQTPSGRKLTLMNPAYMIRQMMEDFDMLYGVKGRITSLKPLNPNNAPDEWETRSLKAFEGGVREVFEITEINDALYLRLMRPMITVKGCLLCHAHQGYKVGDIRGGVGVSVPLDGYFEVGESRKLKLWMIIGGVWVMGLSVIGMGGRRDLQRIEERLSYERSIWQQANFDWLTELPNRNLFHDRLERAISYAQREEKQLALLYIDLDRFKDVNDTRGHHVGDQLLQQAAERLLECVRDMDTVSRLGGDEFAVILTDLSDSMSPNRVAGEVLRHLKQPFKVKGAEIYVSASIGITLFPQDGTRPETLLKNADTAMYQAKESGRNAFRYYTPDMNRLAQERVGLENALRIALERGEFTLHYQPIVSVAEQQLAGVEALVRWSHPDYPGIGPDQFIRVAEQSGLILPIGEWVMRRALEQLLQWDEAGFVIGRISINVSSVQFKSPQFNRFLDRQLADHPQIRNRLCIEITESLFLDGEEQIIGRMTGLRQAGVALAIDDFGTGYSSLSYLKRFPVDAIKIDRAFVRDVDSDPEDAALCEAIVAMAHHLRLRVVAEGVEEESQLAFLARCGCDHAQGYYFGRPVPPDELLAAFQSGIPQIAASGDGA